MKNIWLWLSRNAEIINHLFQGIGTLLIGIAALFALWQTSAVLENVLKIQTQAEDIRGAVVMLNDQIKEQKAEKIITGSRVFQYPHSATKEEIEKALREGINNQPGGGVFLPPQNIERTAEKIYNANTESERIRILKNSLVTNPNPEKIKGGGGPIYFSSESK
jgi:hypothetical protein